MTIASIFRRQPRRPITDRVMATTAVMFETVSLTAFAEAAAVVSSGAAVPVVGCAALGGLGVWGSRIAWRLAR
jgi:hypothetical protein